MDLLPDRDDPAFDNARYLREQIVKAEGEIARLRGLEWDHTFPQMDALDAINELAENELAQIYPAPEIRNALQCLRDAVSAYGDPARQPAGRMSK